MKTWKSRFVVKLSEAEPTFELMGEKKSVNLKCKKLIRKRNFFKILTFI